MHTGKTTCSNKVGKLNFFCLPVYSQAVIVSLTNNVKRQLVLRTFRFPVNTLLRRSTVDMCQRVLSGDFVSKGTRLELEHEDKMKTRKGTEKPQTPRA